MLACLIYILPLSTDSTLFLRHPVILYVGLSLSYTDNSPFQCYYGNTFILTVLATLLMHFAYLFSYAAYSTEMHASQQSRISAKLNYTERLLKCN